MHSRSSCHVHRQFWLRLGIDIAKSIEPEQGPVRTSMGALLRADIVNNASDKELIRCLQDGDLEALGFLYDRHRNLVFRTALGILDDEEAAADLLQDAFMRLYRFAKKVDPERPLEPWLYRVTANLAYTWMKRRSRWWKALREIGARILHERSPGTHKMIEDEDDWERISEAVSSLPLPQRVVVVLYYINDLSVQEIAEILEIPAGTVKSRLFYGRNSIRKKLGMEDDERTGIQYELSSGA